MLKNINENDIIILSRYVPGGSDKRSRFRVLVSFLLNKRIQLEFYISHDETFQEKRALNLLFYKIFEEAIQNEKKVFDFGIFTENGEPKFRLARFKENFGASGIFRDTLELNLTE